MRPGSVKLDRIYRRATCLPQRIRPTRLGVPRAYREHALRRTRGGDLIAGCVTAEPIGRVTSHVANRREGKPQVHVSPAPSLIGKHELPFSSRWSYGGLGVGCVRIDVANQRRNFDQGWFRGIGRVIQKSVPCPVRVSLEVWPFRYGPNRWPLGVTTVTPNDALAS